MTYSAAADHLERLRDEVYPEDIFRPIPDEVLPALDRWLMDTFGRRIDGLSAFYYRRVLSLAATALREAEDSETTHPTSPSAQCRGEVGWGCCE